MPVRKKKGSVSVDFSGVESGGGRAVPDGNYTLEVKEVTEEESSEGNPYLKWVYVITDGPCKGAKVYDNTSLQPQSLWRLKTLLECFGVEVPDSSMDLDLSEYIEQTVDAEVTNEDYQGKQRARITGFLGAGGEGISAKDASKPSKKKDDDDDDAEDDKPAKGGAKKKTTAPKLKEGAKVQFKDDADKTLKGVITAISGDEVTVDVKGEEWELQASEVELV